MILYIYILLYLCRLILFFFLYNYVVFDPERNRNHTKVFPCQLDFSHIHCSSITEYVGTSLHKTKKKKEGNIRSNSLDKIFIYDDSLDKIDTEYCRGPMSTLPRIIIKPFHGILSSYLLWQTGDFKYSVGSIIIIKIKIRS